VRLVEFFDLYGEPLEEAFRQICAFLSLGAKSPEIMLKAMAALTIEIKLLEFVSKIIKEMFVKISLIVMGTALFVTERGNIGLGDLNSRPGDVVFILHQGDAPFVLRKTGRRIGTSNAEKPLYRLIGDCMVQIIIYREAVGPNLETHLVDIK
jgi:hypothetical protein